MVNTNINHIIQFINPYVIIFLVKSPCSDGFLGVSPQTIIVAPSGDATQLWYRWPTDR